MAEAKPRLVQVNELKLLMMSEENCHTDVAKKDLQLMQQQLKNKYKAPQNSSHSTTRSYDTL